MNKETIHQLIIKHKASVSMLKLMQNGSSAEMKNMAGDLYNLLFDDIAEMQLPEHEKAEYFELQMNSEEEVDYVFSNSPASINAAGEFSRYPEKE